MKVPKKKKRGRPKNPNARLNRRTTPGAKKFASTMEALFAEMEAAKEQVFELFVFFTEDVFAGMVARTPVKTGKLKKGWVISTRKTEKSINVVIGNSVFYLKFIEFGFSKKAPKGIVRLTFNEKRKELEKSLKEIIRN